MVYSLNSKSNVAAAAEVSQPALHSAPQVAKALLDALLDEAPHYNEAGRRNARNDNGFPSHHFTCTKGPLQLLSGVGGQVVLGVNLKRRGKRQPRAPLITRR